MKKRNKRILKVLLIILYSTISLFLIVKIIEYAQYVSFINKFIVSDSPNPLGIYENDIYHHTLPRCSKYLESVYQDKNVLIKLKYSFKVHINSLGFRNDEYSIEKKSNQKRIILLGDSFTYGYGLNIEDTFFKVLEKELRNKYQKESQVWNIAAVSWGTVIQYLITKNKLQNYHPDLVVLMFDDSDFYDNIIYEKYSIFENGDIVASHGDINKFYLMRNEFINRIQTYYKTDKIKAKECISKMQVTALKYIKEIARILDRENIPFFVVFYPYPNVDEKYEKKLLQPFFQKLENHNITFYNLYGYFSDEQKNEYYFKGNRHWNKKGSKYVASMLYKYICKNHSEIFK